LRLSRLRGVGNPVALLVEDAFEVGEALQVSVCILILEAIHQPGGVFGEGV
jgi:hypothetical protein